MASVVTFWQMPEEEQRFLAFLRKTGDIIAIPYKNFSTEEEAKFVSLDQLIEHEDPDLLLFGLNSLSKDMKITSMIHRGEKIFTYSYINSPLIVYTRGRLKDGPKLSLSNLATEWKSLTEDRRLVDKPEEFIKWGKRIFQWARRFASDKYEGYRVTQEVAKAIHNHSIELTN